MFLHQQIVQEMEIILNKPDIYKSFTLEWKEKWVPAVITYGRKLKKKDIRTLLQKSDEIDGMYILVREITVLIEKL